MLAATRNVHRDTRYCSDCSRTTAALLLDYNSGDVMCTECKCLLADPFLAIELATRVAYLAPRKKRGKASSNAAVPRALVGGGPANVHRDLRYCSDCRRTTEAKVVDYDSGDVICTECKCLLAGPFLTIGLAAAATYSGPPR